MIFRAVMRAVLFIFIVIAGAVHVTIAEPVLTDALEAACTHVLIFAACV